MQTPALGQRNRTAGRMTAKSTKKRFIMIAFSILLAFSTSHSIHAAFPMPAARMVSFSQKIPFGTTYIDLPDEFRGYEELVSEGVPGERLVNAQLFYAHGRPPRVLGISSTNAGTPVNQVVRRGVKEIRSETADGSPWKTTFIRPLKTGWISAPIDDYPGHTGVDFAAPRGTPVYASAQGKVVLSGWYGDYGWCIILQHDDDTQTLYAHNSWLYYRTGEEVKQGEVIARVGSSGNSTGNHLHFEIRYRGEYLDALLYIDQ